MATSINRKFSVQGYQVALFSENYPEVPATDDLYFTGDNGLVVITQDNEAEVEVTTGEFDANEYKHLTKQAITIGEGGLTVGNVLTADTESISFPAGKATVDVYVDNDEVRKAAKVVFALS